MHRLVIAVLRSQDSWEPPTVTGGRTSCRSVACLRAAPLRKPFVQPCGAAFCWQDGAWARWQPAMTQCLPSVACPSLRVLLKSGAPLYHRSTALLITLTRGLGDAKARAQLLSLPSLLCCLGVQAHGCMCVRASGGAAEQAGHTPQDDRVGRVRGQARVFRRCTTGSSLPPCVLGRVAWLSLSCSAALELQL